MKIEWQTDDIAPGRIVGRPDRLERWLIGYHDAPDGQVYCLVSLSDGMVQPFRNKVDLAKDLNKSGDIPIEFFSDPARVKRGQKGGAARSAALSPERRSEIASTAARTRWNGLPSKFR